MSDFDRLKDKLGKLGKLGDRRVGATLDTSTDVALLHGLALLVDETILPRLITLSAGSKTVDLTVTKRRLISVAGAAAAEFEDDDTDATLARLGRDLARIFVGAKLSIRSERAEIPPELQGAGPPAETIAAAWKTSLYGAAQQAGPDLVEFLKEKAYAWATWEGETATDHGGDADYLKVLRKKLPRAEIRAQHGGAKGLVALGGNGFATAIGVAWDGGSEVAFVIARIDLAVLARTVAAR